jgi:signal transduction histidine kinase
VLAVILSNLVRNAIKFTGDEDRAIRRVILRGSADGQRLRLEVEDTGPGIPPGAVARIFEPFVRLPGAGTKPGIGLGLATVKRFVEASGGTVGVDGRPGQGSCFWITLPLAAPAPPPQPRVPAADQARA